MRLVKNLEVIDFYRMRDGTNMITQTELKTRLHYNPFTGVFSWVLPKGRTLKSGAIAGTTHHSGYRQIKIDGQLHQSHRLAWLYVHGYFPLQDLDHVNGDRSNNKLNNLRLASRAENTQNQRKARIDNTGGYLGVSFVKRTSRWRARIQIKSKPILIGYFATPIEAHEAYLQAKRLYHPFCTI